MRISCPSDKKGVVSLDIHIYLGGVEELTLHILCAVAVLLVLIL